MIPPMSDAPREPSPEPYLAISVETVAGRHELKVGGELDVGTVPELARSAQPLVDGKRGFVVDLSDVSFVDSAGLNFLMTLHRQAADESWELALRRPRPGVFETFEVAVLDLVFTWVDDAP